jgi:hypothetical protein
MHLSKRKNELSALELGTAFKASLTELSRPGEAGEPSVGKRLYDLAASGDLFKFINNYLGESPEQLRKGIAEAGSLLSFFLGRDDSVLRLSSFFAALNRPLTCFHGALEHHNALLAAEYELGLGVPRGGAYSALTVEAPLFVAQLNATCDFPVGLQKVFSVEYEMSDLGYGEAKSGFCRGIHAIGGNGNYPVRDLFNHLILSLESPGTRARYVASAPVIHELTARVFWNDLLLVLAEPRTEDLSKWSRLVSDLGGSLSVENLTRLRVAAEGVDAAGDAGIDRDLDHHLADLVLGDADTIQTLNCYSF